MPRSSPAAGIGALGSAPARFFHPSAKIREKFPNNDKRRLEGVIITGQGTFKVNRRQQECYCVRIDEFDDGTIFHIVRGKLRIDQAAAVPFVPPPAPRASTNIPGEAVDPDRSAQTNARSNIEGSLRAETREEINELRQQGIVVDDDNEPAPENARPQTVAEQIYAAGHWEKPTVCPRRASGVADVEGKFKNTRWDEIADLDELALFRVCFPEKWIVGVVIPKTNEALKEKPLDLREFYVWLGCIFFMSSFQGIEDRDLWWSTKPVDMFDGAPFRLNEYMSKGRFNDIMAAIRYTNDEAPLFFVDRFHEVREMIEAFNDHYSSEYLPSWLSCIDESMNTWLNKFCPGFMCVPRKPRPFGNEYHSIADGDGGKPIMWRINLVEGKDRPKLGNGRWAFETKWERQGYTKTAALLLEMTEPLHGTGKMVTGDSGFCVAKAVMDLHAKGVYFQSLIKKRWYWPAQVPGDQIDAHMMTKGLGETETFVQSIEGVRFLVHCTRDSQYVTKIMSTHGLLEEIQDHPTWRLVDGEWKTFKYAEPLSRHNRAKHWVDDVNNRRHAPIGLEEMWRTKWWPNRQFTFILSVVEVNCVQARARARKEASEPTLTFRRKLAMRMLTNRIGTVVAPSPLRVRTRTSTNHVHRKRKKHEGLWDYTTRKFAKRKTEYIRHPCVECGKSTRSYCQCDPGRALCMMCFGVHSQEQDC